MRKVVIIISAFCMLLSCKKVDFVIPDEPFTDLRMEKVTANNAWYEVVPANNDFYYLATYVPKSMADLYGDALVDTLDRVMRNIYDIMAEGKGDRTSFEEACLDKGSFYEAVNGLYAGAEYVAVGFPYNQDGTPVHKLTRYGFKTPVQPSSTNTFTFEMTGSVVTVTPSNSDSFFWDYERKETVDKDYVYPSYYFSVMIDYYWEYGFLEPEYLSHGLQESDMNEFFDLKVGDKFYLMASGYDNGMSTDLATYVATYNGPGKKADVEPYQKPAALLPRALRKGGFRL